MPGSLPGVTLHCHGSGWGEKGRALGLPLMVVRNYK